LDEFLYANEALPGVTTVASALNYLTAVLYPQAKAAVANPAALPAVGNTINDMRVVTDDGDGKAASYRWEQREGEASASWHKIYDLDFGTDSILQAYMIKTQDVYVSRFGYDDLDASGLAITGLYAGQRIYGGKSANTNLTLSANSGDGVGAGTGYVQFSDNTRPATDSAYSLGTTSERWLKIWTDEITSGTLTIVGGSITDSSGAISFDNENLTTTGSVTAGTLLLAGGSITDSTGAISFGNENLTTTGDFSSNKVTATGAASQFFTGTQVADFTFTNGNIASSSATVSFNALNLTTTGTGTFGLVDVDSVRINNSLISITASNTDLDLQANGTGKIDFLSDAQFAGTNISLTGGGDVTVTDGFISVSGTGAYVSVDNLTLDGNTLSSTDANGNVILDPNGTGLVELTSGFFPTTDSAHDIGKSGNVWNKLWIDGSIGGATEITLADLLTLRSVTFRDAGRTTPAQSGDALFYDGSQWLASPPDTEIDHGTISGLLDDDHTQYALLAGRSGGQSLVGGTAASNNLNLESTAHATKGFIQFKDVLRPFTDASYSGSWSGTDLGDSSHNLRHLYSKGEHFGLRLENVGANPSASAQNIGRVVWNTADETAYADTGTVFKKLGANRYESDTSWNGSDLTKSVTVSGVDARKAIWQLKNNSDDFAIVFVRLTSTSATNVTITTTTPLAAGSYRLIGLE
jgi:hypothetical protein